MISINSPWREHLLSSGYRYETQCYPVHKELKLQRTTHFTNVKWKVACASRSCSNQSMVRISSIFILQKKLCFLIAAVNYLSCCTVPPEQKLQLETKTEVWSSTSHLNLGHQTPWFLLSLSVKLIFLSKYEYSSRLKFQTCTTWSCWEPLTRVLRERASCLLTFQTISRTAYCNVTSNYLSQQIRKITKQVRREEKP